MSQSKEPTDTELKMVLYIKQLSGEIARLKKTEIAAIHLVKVIGMSSKTGVPTFRFNEGQEANVPILQHAILDLHSNITGVPAPELALAGRVLH